MLTRIVLAIIVAAAVGLGCIFLGMLLASLGIPITDAVAAFLTTWGWVIGVLAGLWFFFSGGSFPSIRS
jgi:hypothetical protein